MYYLHGLPAGWLLWMAALLLLTGSAGPTPVAARPVPVGIWGGPDGYLTTSATGATYHTSCGAATIEQRIVQDARGQFEASGVFTGLDPAGGGQYTQIIRLQGQITARTLHLNVVFNSAERWNLSQVLTFGEGGSALLCY